MKILITGATGFVGREVSKHLVDRGHQLVVLTRDEAAASRKIGVPCEAHSWDALKAPAPAEAFSGVSAIIHLAGEPITAGRWTQEVKSKIYNSRVIGTQNLAKALTGIQTRPIKIISASAIGFYGDRGEEVLTENSPHGNGFLSDVCVDWESEVAKAEIDKSVILRFGVVLGHGGALEKMLPIFQKGLGGPLGNGQQWMSWIHIRDLVSMITMAVEDPDLSGVFNAVSPNPITNEIFTYLLGQALRKPVLLRVPKLVLKAAFGKMADETFLASTRVISEAIQRRGFSFEFAELEPALKDIFNRATRNVP